jgi:peptidoglycan hydrolase-like protein with peptidoglycan-binding domain
MTSRRRQLGLVLTLPALVAPAVVLPAAPAGAAVKAPPTKSLPAALDVYVPYQGQTICDPRPRPGVVAFARLMTTHYAMGSVSLIGRTCGSGPSEHYDGRAWDWMLNVANPSQEAVAQSVLAWLTAPDKNGVQGAMARRFGIMYIIHNRKMWRAYAPERGWAPYYGSSPHTDHIHFSFTYNGAAGRTSWWTGVAQKTVLTTLPPAGTTLPSSPTTPPAPTPSTPVPSTTGALSYGMTSPAVKTLQTRLGGLPVTGFFGTLTKARVIEYQKFVGLPANGVADLRTQQVLAQRGWRTVTAAYPTLRAGMTSGAVKTLQVKLGGVPATGYYGTLTKARVTAYQKYSGLPTTGVADPVTQARLWVRGWTRPAAPAATTTTTPTTYPTLRLGMTSAAVKTLQTRLGALPTTGYFGTMTQARVTAYQRFAGLSVTGIADSRTQQVLYTRGWSTASPASFVTAAPAQEEPAMTTFAAAPATFSPGVAHVEVDTAYTRFKDLTLGPGSRGAAVRVLQRGLGGLAVDGVFGSVTQDKVVALQRSMALPPTGVVTPEVWDVLEARDFPFATSRSTVLREGDTGPQVVAVQRLLGIHVTGVFDSATRDAVKKAQARAGLASTGVVASRTWSLFDRLSA